MNSFWQLRLLLCVALLAAAAPASAQDRRFEERYDPPAEAGEPSWNGAGAIKDGYPEPVPAPPLGYKDTNTRGSYKDDAAPPPPVRRAAQCLSKPGLRSALNEQGWYDFDHVDYRGELAFMTANNDRGRRFEVEFDACSGDVVKARPLTVYVERPAYPPPVYFGHRYYGPPRPYVGLHAHRWHHHRHRHWR